MYTTGRGTAELLAVEHCALGLSSVGYCTAQLSSAELGGAGPLLVDHGAALLLVVECSRTELLLAVRGDSWRGYFPQRGRLL